MNTLVIHAGTGKTGSTAIQRFFYSSWSGNDRDGISYPDAGNFHHNALEAVVLPQDRWHRAFRILTPPERARLLEEADTTVRLIKTEGQRGSSVLVSSEYLCSLGTPAINRLLERFRSCFSQIVCVLYVREPTALITSSIQQVLKLDHRIAKTLGQTYPFRNMISNWETSDHLDRLVVRAFSESPNWDVVWDFINVIEGLGIPIPDERKPCTERGSRANISMSTEECIVLQRAKIKLHIQPTNSQRELNTLINRGVTNAAKGLVLSKFQLLPSICEQIEKAHMGDLAWLSENYDISFSSNLLTSGALKKKGSDAPAASLIEEIAPFSSEDLDRLIQRFGRFCYDNAPLWSVLSR